MFENWLNLLHWADALTQVVVSLTSWRSAPTASSVLLLLTKGEGKHQITFFFSFCTKEFKAFTCVLNATLNIARLPCQTYKDIFVPIFLPSLLQTFIYQRSPKGPLGKGVLRCLVFRIKSSENHKQDTLLCQNKPSGRTTVSNYFPA